MLEKVMKAKVFACRNGMTDSEWRESRRHGIGGSDASAIAGFNPYSSAYGAYMDKLGLLPEKEDNEAMRQGRDLEEYVACRFTDYMSEHGKTVKVRNCNYILQHADPEYSFMLANVDRLIVGENAGLECKTTSVYNKTDFEGGDVPPNYYIQCQHYMAVTGAEKWYLAILVLNKALYVFEIPRNDKDIAELMSLEKEFWDENVLKKREPAPSGSEADAEILTMLYPNSNENSVDLMPLQSELTAYMELDGKIKELETQQDKVKQTVQNYMGEASEGAYEGVKVSWKTINKTSLDSKKLKQDLSDIFEKYSKQTTYRMFKVSQAKA